AAIVNRASFTANTCRSHGSKSYPFHRRDIVTIRDKNLTSSLHSRRVLVPLFLKHFASLWNRRVSMSQRRIHLHAIAATAVLLLICLVALSRSNPVRAEDSRKEMDFHKNPAVANAAEKVLMGE